jgi:DNA-binding protein HU-beta
MVAALNCGKTVELRNFGIFKTVQRLPRMGRNPKNPAVPIPIPAQNRIKFRPGKHIRRTAVSQ